MKTLLSVLFLFFTLSFTAQIPEQLIGKWNYQSVYEKEKLSEKELKHTETLFSDLMFKFKEGGYYISAGNGKMEEGNWTFNNNSIDLQPFKGKKTHLEIIELKDDTLILKMEKMSFIMERQGATKE